MKKYVLFFCLLLGGGLINAQEGQRCLSTIQNHQKMMEENPEYKKRVLEWQKKSAPLIKDRREQKNPTCSNGPILVPIAFHFDSGLVPAAQEACAISIVLDQLDELNKEMLGLDADAGLINQFTSCFGSGILGDACVQFCLATLEHPTGYGLVDGDYAITFGQLNFNVPGGNLTPVNTDWAAYMNVYVDDLAGGLLGVSNGIPGGFNGDGVLVDNCVFGTGAISCSGVQTTGSSGCFALYDEGETLAHEIGHYFGLYHIWGDNSNCNGQQDQIADTPDMNTNYSGYSSCSSHTQCSNLPQTCGDEDMYMNFMSYASDGCMYMFTSDQSDVMNTRAVFEGFTTTTSKCGDAAPVADFAPSGNITICDMDCISFTDLSTNSPDSWLWIFTSLSGNLTFDIMTSTDQNPIICHTGGTSGTIEAELMATNSGGTGTIAKNLIISIGVEQTYYEDIDGDGFGNPNSSMLACEQPPEFVLDNTDCDDLDPNNFPGNPEVCDEFDNNCDGNIDEGVITTYYADTDGDGFGDPANAIDGCSAPMGYVIDNTDCDDTDPNNFPGNTEVCDGFDNDCDGMVDEDGGNTYYADTDDDGFGDPNNTTVACSAPMGFITDNTDCDDNDPYNYPGNTEVCDGQDNDCDGDIDENGNVVFYADTDSDGFGDPNNTVLACSLPVGYTIDNTDCDDTDPNSFPGNPEVCDGADNNCDGNFDEGVLLTFYADADEDGYGDSNVIMTGCFAPVGFVSNDGDCDDADPDNFPGNPEVCDGFDNNCDGIVDEGCGPPPPCDDDYLVINMIGPTIYRAEINIYSNAVVNSATPILFTAGTDIDLVHPFEVILGTDFEARIQPCDNTLMEAEDPDSFRSLLDEEYLTTNVFETFNDDETFEFYIENEIGLKIWSEQMTKTNFLVSLKSQTFGLDKGTYKFIFSNQNKNITQKVLILK